MAQLEGIERQWEAKKQLLAEELERVEKLLANAYDRYVWKCEQLIFPSQMEESVTTQGIFQSIPAVLGDGDCLTNYAGGWGLLLGVSAQTNSH